MMVSTENESEMKRSGRGRSKKARLYASAKALVKWKGLDYPQVRSPESIADSTNVQIAPRAGNVGAPVGLRADMVVCSWPT